MELSLPASGALVAARYRLIKEIGRGGYGVVFEARQEAINRSVAIKFLHPDVSQDAVEVERFRREVFHASGLNHPNTITLYDYGQTPQGLFYVVMEYLKGHNLRQWLAVHGKMSYDDVFSCVTQILSSLREAHQRGIVHRDLKLENLFMQSLDDDKPFIKVLDFGLSKFIGEPDEDGHFAEPLTADGEVHGTPQYMAPEHVYGEAVGPPADVYTVGLVAYELLTGKTAFDGRAPVEVMHMQAKSPMPALPSSLQHTDLARFIEICTKKDAEDRFANAGEALLWLQNPDQKPGENPWASTFQNLPEVSVGASIRQDTVTPSKPALTREFLCSELDMRLAQMPMIGRDDEFERLLSWSRRALETGGILWLSGDVGAGKTRLVDEWLQLVAEDNRVQILRGQYRRQGIALEGLREALSVLTNPSEVQSARETLGMTRDEISELQTILQIHARPESGNASDVSGLYPTKTHDALGRDWACARIEQSLLSLAQSGPTVLVLEDLDWADSFTLRLIEHLHEDVETHNLPLALVFTSVQGSAMAQETGPVAAVDPLADRLPPALRWSSEVCHIKLGPLAESDTRAILERLSPVSAGLVDHLTEMVHGNPMYLIQVARYLVSEGLVEYDSRSKRWELDPKATVSDLVPPDLKGMAVRRVEMFLHEHPLGSMAREVLRRAAIIGHRFDVEVLAQVLRDGDQGPIVGRLDEILLALQDGAIIVEIHVDGHRAYEFAHPHLRVAWMRGQRQSEDENSAIHELVARAKIDSYLNVANRSVYEIAHGVATHFKRAGALEESFKWWMRAARYAEKVHDFQGALVRYREAEAVFDIQKRAAESSDSRRLLAIRLAQGRLHRVLGEFGPAEDALRSALHEARRAADSDGEARASEALASVLKLIARYDEAETLYTRVASHHKSSGDHSAWIGCSIGFAEIYAFKGNYLKAESLLERALTAADGLEDPTIRIRCLLGLGRCAYAAGRLPEALALFEQARAGAVAIDDAILGSTADIETACVLMTADGISNSEQLARHALAVKRRLGDVLGQAHAHLILGMSLRRSLRLDVAQYHARRARILNERLAHTYGIAKCILLEAELSWARGDIEEALLYARDSRRLHAEIQDAHGLALSLLYEGLFESEAGRGGRARSLLQETLRLGGRQGVGVGLYLPHGLLFMGMAFEAERNIEEAVAYYGEALQVSEARGNREFASLAAISLAKLHLVFGDIEAARMELPLARAQADAVGHVYAMGMALTGQAWLAHLTRDAVMLEEATRKLRALVSAPNGPKMRIGPRLHELGQLVLKHQPRDKAVVSVRALIDLLLSLNENQLAAHLQNDIM